MQYGFVIDHRKCIGCHACTVACKSENEVPVGDFRTWVKYVDKGTFPEVKRHFTVLRCNHCDAAPCVEICPTVALHKRPDAIVDLDRDRCIGCRSCMQACPYDALYLNDDTGTAEKCHYCAHRTELGLEPACVVVCPERAIVAGDVSDPEAEIATLIDQQPTSQRKVEKGTKPRVWYVDALEDALIPGSATEPPQYIWSDRPTPQPTVPAGFEPPPDLVNSLDVGHPPVWGWHIWSYLVTKNIAAGVMLLAPFLAMLGVSTPQAQWAGVAPELVALFFVGVTGFLLVHDLGRPARFLKILLTPNPRSWLVKGAWALAAFGLVTTASLVLRMFGDEATSDLLRWINLPLAGLASGYTAFLFWQCRGRDLWLGKDLLVHLLVMAAMMGSSVALLLRGGTDALIGPETLFVILAALNGAWLTWAKGHRPATRDGQKAHALLYGSRQPALASVLLYASALLVLAIPHLPTMDAALRVLACGLSVFALVLYERAWVRAGQEVPLS